MQGHGIINPVLILIAALIAIIIISVWIYYSIPKGEVSFADEQRQILVICPYCGKMYPQGVLKCPICGGG